MIKKIKWEEFRRTEFADAVTADGVVIIPVASTEQHGDHLPVNTDASACYTIACRAAEAVRDFPVIVLPVMWTGFSSFHRTYPGTITLRYETFVNLLTDVATSVFANGFRKILFLNGHGSNDVIIAGVKNKLAVEDHVSTVLAYSWWNMPGLPEQIRNITESKQTRIDHAGELETSLQQHLFPELVDKNSTFWSQGVYGDPSLGTAEKGERLLGYAIEVLTKLLQDFHSGKLEHDLRRFKNDVYVGHKDL
ncbi:MAG: creatininase family protein [Chloroflexi bacterium]|nr:creatininase family protein [Chloroflexota bacterium]